MLMRAIRGGGATPLPPGVYVLGPVIYPGTFEICPVITMGYSNVATSFLPRTASNTLVARPVVVSVLA